MRQTLDSKSALAAIFPAIVLAISASLPADAKVVYEESVERFDLGASLKTKHHIWQAIKRLGPNVHGNNAIGTAQGQIGYKFRTQRSGGQCSVNEAQVDVKVKITLPALEQIYELSPEAQDFFECVLQTVTIHEKRHAEIWIETAQEVENAFADQLRDMQCSRIKQESRSIYREIFNQSRRRQSNFDATDKDRGRYQACWRGEQNLDSPAYLPETSGNLPWNESSNQNNETPSKERAEATPTPTQGVSEQQSATAVEPQTAQLFGTITLLAIALAGAAVAIIFRS